MNYRRTKRLIIRTPEGVDFSFRLAGPIARFLAITVDNFVKMALALTIGKISLLLNIISIDFQISFYIIESFIIYLGYSIIFEWYWQGQTIGKRLFCIRVMDAEGLHLHFSQIVIRNLLHVVDMLPVFYLVGGIACFLSPKAQRLGDLAGNTIVVYVPKIASPDLKHLLKDKYNSFRDYPHLCSRLRQNISPDEAQMAMQAIIRRDEFNLQDRIELFNEMVEYYHSKVVFPEEVTEGLSSEQYVKNIVDVLFSSTEP